MIRAFIQSQQRQAPAYVTWEVGVGMLEDTEISEELNKDYRLIPEGLVFRLGSEQDFQQSSQPQLITRGLDDGSFTFAPDDVVEQKIRPAYVTMLVNRGRYLEVLGKTAEAAEFYRAALKLDPNSVIAQQALSRR